MRQPNYTYHLKIAVVLIFIIQYSSLSNAQDVKPQDLLEFADSTKEEFSKYKKIKNIPFFQFYSFKDGKLPVIYQSSNLEMARVLKNNFLWSGGVSGLSLSGNGQIIGYWDEDQPRLTHQEYSGRVSFLDSESGTNNDHATQMVGTMIATGVDADARGMANAAEVEAYNWNNDIGEMAQAAADSLTASAHPYAEIAGWTTSSTVCGSGYTWYSLESENPSKAYQFGYYNSQAQDWDSVAYLAPDYLIVKAAGNIRGIGPESQPVKHWKIDSNLNCFEDSTSVRQINGGEDGFESISGSSVSKNVFGKEYDRLKQKQHMAKLINYALVDIMLRFKNSLIFGEDIAQKGGVYHVTADLYNKFGVRRVFNSPLDETSIIGFAMGFAHNGFIPIPEIQFLAYFHNAEDQLRGEAATLPFFSKGQFTNPMVLRVPGLAYQRGFGGHFHNDNSLAVFRDIPGIILGVPSNGADAVKMLRTALREAYENGRVVVFVEPIALYMTKDLHEQKDDKWKFQYPDLEDEIPLGEFCEYGKGKSLTILTYGNGLFLSLQAKPEIEKRLKTKIKVIDLRWLSEINIPNLLKSIGTCNKVLIVDECRKTGCHGEGLLTQLESKSQKTLDIKLHAADDCFIPLGDAAMLTLPSRESIINNSIKLINE